MYTVLFFALLERRFLLLFVHGDGGNQGAAAYEAVLVQQFDAFAALLEDGHPRVRAVAAKVKNGNQNIAWYVVFDVLIQPSEVPSILPRCVPWRFSFYETRNKRG